jgi:hypothetical protein
MRRKAGLVVNIIQAPTFLGQTKEIKIKKYKKMLRMVRMNAVK